MVCGVSLFNQMLFLRTDSALRHTVDSFFWLYFYLMNYQESLVISIVVFVEVGLNF